MELSIHAKKSSIKKADITFNSESQIAYQVEALREISQAEPMTDETKILLNIIIEMVTEQRLLSSSVIPISQLSGKLKSVKSKMMLINKVSQAIRHILYN